tara:strand:- start:37 stop:213 length:177 start_codon:yes stop_codon:yes gene_type:complete
VIQLLDFEIEWEREYDLLLAVNGTSVKSYVDGQSVNDVALDGDPWGTIYLGTMAITRF